VADETLEALVTPEVGGCVNRVVSRADAALDIEQGIDFGVLGIVARAELHMWH
jgi:hypothetical protein